MTSTPDRPSATKSGNSYVPDRGDILKTNYSPQAGSEQSGYRPALVLTSRTYNEVTGLCQAAPITNQQKGYPFEVVLPDGLKTSGVVLVDHVKCLDWSVRGARFVETAPEDLVEDAQAKLTALFGL